MLAAELWGRALVARGQLPNRMPADLFASHPIGWTLEPGLEAKIPTVNGLVEVTVNEAGFRDENYPLARLSMDEPLYSPGPDIHWTSEGHAVVADALFEWLDLES